MRAQIVFRTTIAIALAAFVLASCENTSFYSVLGNKAQIQPLAISPASTTVSSNGTIQFSASGGVPPYTFSILSGVGSINSSSGLYTAPATPGTTYVLVTDKQGSTAKATVTNVDYNVIAITDTSTSHGAGSAISGNFTMKNVGTANGGQNVNWAIYLSTSPTLGAGGTVINANTTTPLNAGATSSPISFAGTWPTTPGTYYLIATVSAPDGLTEPNNSLATGAISVTAANVNYVASAVTVTSGSSGPPGGAMTGSFTLTNSGANGGTQFVTWQAYASTTNTVTGSSVLLGTGSIGPLASGNSLPITITGATWPITYGNYYLVVRSSVPVDSNTSNNVPFPTSTTTAIGFYSATASDPGNDTLATAVTTPAANLGVTLQPGMSIKVTGNLPTTDATDYLGFNTGTAASVTFNLTWTTTGASQLMTMYVYIPSPLPLGTPFTGLQTQNNTSLIMPWTVDLANQSRYISIQLSGTPLVAAGAYTLIITAN